VGAATNVLLRLCVYHSHCGSDLKSRLAASFRASSLWSPGLNPNTDFNYPCWGFTWFSQSVQTGTEILP
jgi:hypothetical protein